MEGVTFYIKPLTTYSNHRTRVYNNSMVQKPIKIAVTVLLVFFDEGLNVPPTMHRQLTDQK